MDLSETEVTDQHLRELRGLRLTEITLRNTGITDVGLQHLSTMPNLEFINVSRTKVTGEGLRFFDNDQLKVIVADDACFSDSVVPILLKMTRLDRLSLNRNYLSQTSVDQLKNQGIRILEIDEQLPNAECAEIDHETGRHKRAGTSPNN